jgi:hypothetical protein
MMYLQAIYQTFKTMGPHYAVNIYKWFKMALWDTPYRLYLDIELEKMKLERDLSRLESYENDSHSD